MQKFDEFLNKYLNEQDETVRAEYKKQKKNLKKNLKHREHNKNVISLETLVEKQLIDAMLSNQTRKIHIDNISIDNACWSDNIQSCVYINTEDSYHQSVKDELKKELDLLKAYER